MHFTLGKSYDFPNILLCPNNWVDFDKVESLNLSYNALKCGLEYLFSFSQRKYILNTDLTEIGQKEFFQFFQENSSNNYLNFLHIVSKNYDQVAETKSKYPATYVYKNTKIFYDKQICYLLDLPKHDCVLQTSNFPPIITMHFLKDERSINLNVTEDEFHVVYVDPDLKFPAYAVNNFNVYKATKYKIKLSSLRKFTRLNNYDNPCKETSGGNVTYSQNFCHSDCIQHRFFKVYSHCLMFGLFESTSDDRNTSLCNSITNIASNISKSEELQSVWSTIVNNCSEECLPTCTQSLIEVTVTAENNNYNSQAEEVASVSNLEIIFDVCVHGIMEYEEFERYTFENLISDIGGVLGLWLGASAITFVQLIMFVLEICALKTRNKIIEKIDNRSTRLQ